MLLLLASCQDVGSPAGGDSSLSEPDSAPVVVDGLPPDGPASMPLGQFEDFVADSAGRISGSVEVAGHEQFLLLLMSLDPTALKVHTYTTRSPDASKNDAQQLPAQPAADKERFCNFDARLRALLASVDTTLTAPKEYCFSSLPPEQGDTRTFNVQGSQVEAEALYVDDTAAFWIDRTTTPLATVDNALLQQLVDGFGTIVVPRLRVYFGHESDLDGDGHISILFTPLTSQASAIAYFSPCDLVEPSVVPTCSESNMMELLYVAPPNRLPPLLRAPDTLLETLAHELQHAIYFFHKYLLNDNVVHVDNPYVTEGLSHLAEDLSGYQASNLYTLKAVLQGIDWIAVPNLISPALDDYQPRPDDSFMRGGDYLLLRYLFDQAGGDVMDAAGTPQENGGGATWLRSFVATADTGEDAVSKTSGLTMQTLIQQFWTTVALSNRGPNGSPLNEDSRYNFQPTMVDPLTNHQRGCSLAAELDGTNLDGAATQEFLSADGQLRAGGAEFLLLRPVNDNSRLAFEVVTTPEAKARLRLIRIK